MKLSIFGRYVLGIGAATTLISACTGLQAPTGGPGETASRAERLGSMQTNTQSGELLYVAYEGKVLFSPLPQGRPVTELAGLWGSVPAIYAPTEMATCLYRKILKLEYAHGETSPINTLSGYGGACSWDPTRAISLWLAATRLQFSSDAEGVAQTFADSNVSFYACTYDEYGDLFLLGETPSSVYEFGRVQHQQRSFYTHFAEQSINMYDLAWDGTYVAINGGGRDSAEINRVAVSGSVGTVVSTVSLKQEHRPRGRLGLEGLWSWLGDGTFIAPSGGDGKLGKDIDFWSYPAGGEPASVCTSATEIFMASR